ncbi:hypothetical protein [Aphanothece microscopica]|uniref:hypothetical protein n=2 Tax=Aphanothece TaxID=1121 RepID=UPI003984DEEE
MGEVMTTGAGLSSDIGLIGMVLSCLVLGLYALLSTPGENNDDDDSHPGGGLMQPVA